MLLGLKSEKDLNKQRSNSLTSLLRLRQICCHSALAEDVLGEQTFARSLTLDDLKYLFAGDAPGDSGA
jgi:hypothetical protein